MQRGGPVGSKNPFRGAAVGAPWGPLGADDGDKRFSIAVRPHTQRVTTWSGELYLTRGKRI